MRTRHGTVMVLIIGDVQIVKHTVQNFALFNCVGLQQQSGQLFSFTEEECRKLNAAATH